ncbi:SDR family oxidoreductase [Spirillospora sp. CA-253888]
MNRTLLITGATGSVSTALLAALEGSEYDIRALVRDPAKAAPLQARGVEVVLGDLEDPGSLPPAFKGVQDLWLLVPNGPRAPEQSMNAVWAARQAGVERVVRLSAIGAAHDAPTRSGRLHALSDRELQESGMGWTILRPHWFMQNLLNEAGGIAAQGSFSLNAGDGRLGMIDVRDVAAFAARVLTDGPQRHDGKVYTPSGPRPVSFFEVARRLGDVLGRPVGYLPVTDEAQRAALLGHGVPAWITDMLIEYSQAYAAGWGDYTTDDFRDVVGRPPRDVDDFIRDHAGAFS